MGAFGAGELNLWEKELLKAMGQERYGDVVAGKFG